MTRRRLQDELKQTRPFPGLLSEALVSILRTAAVIDHAFGDALKPHGITPAQYNVLRILRGAEPDGLCGREIGERLIAQVPDVSRLLDRMVALELIGRQRDPADRRHVTARITPRGLQLLLDLEPVVTAVEERWTGSLSEAQLRSLIEGLETVRDPG